MNELSDALKCTAKGDMRNHAKLHASVNSDKDESLQIPLHSRTHFPNTPNQSSTSKRQKCELQERAEMRTPGKSRNANSRKEQKCELYVKMSCADFEPLKIRETDWDPKDVKITLNLCTEACIVPTGSHSARLSFGHLLVFDDFLSRELQQELFHSITNEDWTEANNSPPEPKWSRQTCDQAGLPPTWGLQDTELRKLILNPPPSMIEIQSRLSKLYPEVEIFHMPSEMIQEFQSDEEVKFDCDKFVANAAIVGDQFQWHVDADPWTFHETSKFVQRFGNYFNGDPRKPLFVSLILYLNSDWEQDWDAETLFLDSHTETGVFIRPKLGRVVLMEQDILHRLSCPSLKAQRPRYSFVWKLIFIAKEGNVQLSRPEFGTPTYFGSAAKAKSVQDALFADPKP